MSARNPRCRGRDERSQGQAQKNQAKGIPRHVATGGLSNTALAAEQAETALVAILRPHLNKEEEARALIRALGDKLIYELV
ncbi:MAG: hypothetical protein HQL76_16110 [Magnetococcales bacterium]|nr:hypothetical protein [Magnetococcales bacterium]